MIASTRQSSSKKVTPFIISTVTRKEAFSNALTVEEGSSRIASRVLSVSRLAKEGTDFGESNRALRRVCTAIRNIRSNATIPGIALVITID
jgi:hypothetical protein